MVKGFLLYRLVVHIEFLSGSVLVIILIDQSCVYHFKVDQLELLRLSKEDWVLSHEGVPFYVQIPAVLELLVIQFFASLLESAICHFIELEFETGLLEVNRLDSKERSWED